MNNIRVYAEVHWAKKITQRYLCQRFFRSYVNCSLTPWCAQCGGCYLMLGVTFQEFIPESPRIGRYRTIRIIQKQMQFKFPHGRATPISCVEILRDWLAVLGDI